MSNKVYFVNAFADTYYKGNTAAVVPVSDFVYESRMLDLAKEFGFSETAFVRKLETNRYQIRWFTPEVEVKLCGHATLASAKVLFSEYLPNEKRIIFESLSGELIATQNGDQIELDFPPDAPVPCEVSDYILDCVCGIKPLEVLYSAKTKNLILVYLLKTTVTEIKPDFARLTAFEGLDFHGIIVTASYSNEGEYVCRYFAPWEGINEDPVTGSAQTCLAPYWVERLNKNPLKGFQASERGGHFTVEVRDERVLIRGKALIYMRGELSDGWDQ